jgi:Lipase maturation factor
MAWLWAPGDWWGRLVLHRGLAIVYLVAFLVAARQNRALLGERGLVPIPDYVRRIGRFRDAPSIFLWRYSDRLLDAVAWTGVVLALLALVGVVDSGPIAVSMLGWFLLWALYLSIANVGQVWYSFGWESLLLEVGFLAVFLGPDDVAPPWLVFVAVRWVLFRLEFGAGLIKLRGDRCWRELTCLDHHHETQPMPNPLSWWFHRLPKPLHRVEVIANFAAQLVAPVLLFAPQPICGVAAAVMAITQAYLLVSGNFSWLNAVTIVLALSLLGGSWLDDLLPADRPSTLAEPDWFAVVSIAFAVLIVVLSRRPAMNLVSRRQKMNASFDSLHLVNTYGAFGSVTKVRHEIVIEGTDDEVLTPETEWREYGFKGKPGDVRRRPPQIAPYHLRLDWLMWFAALSPAYADQWWSPFIARLLANDAQTLRLLKHNPFPDSPPAWIRARFFRYRYTTWSERRATGAWWHRDLVGDFMRPQSLVARRR